MEKAVDNVENMFNKAEADLNYLLRKLEFQVENEQGSNTQQNPVKLLKKVEEIKAEYSELTQDVCAIQKAQKEAMDFFRGQLGTLAQMLGKLETETGCGPELSEETLNHFEQLSECLGMPKEEILLPAVEPSDAECGQDTTDKPVPPAQVASSSSASASKSSEKPDAKQEELTPELSASDLRAGSSEFIELSQSELMSVSELVRGRAKLDEVNKTYKLLWLHFKEEHNTEALTLKEMNSKGMRVTGATGQAKLKILRALKLCSISKAGDVKLL